MARLGATPTAQLRTVAVDLGTDYPMMMLNIGFGPNQLVARLVEGLLIGYRSADAQERLLEQITDLSAAGNVWLPQHAMGTGADWQRAMSYVTAIRCAG